MSKKLLLAIAALALVVSCDRRNERQEEQPRGEVIERDTQVIEQQPGELQEREEEKGSEDVEYTTKRQVTEEVKREQDIPTIETKTSRANINEMNQNDFIALGFDKQSAERIVKTREERGNFKSVDELSQIPGVSQETLMRVRNNLGVSTRQAQEED